MSPAQTHITRPFIAIDLPRHDLHNVDLSHIDQLHKEAGDIGTRDLANFFDFTLNSNCDGASPAEKAKSEETRGIPKKLGIASVEQVCDFYLLNYMWFWSGEGQKAYGYPESETSSLIPTSIREKLAVEMAVTTEILGRSLEDAMDRAIISELRHARWSTKNKARPEDYDGLASYEMDLNANEYVQLMGGSKEAADFDERDCAPDLRKKIFAADWKPSYGGGVWYDACVAHEALKKELALDRLPKLITTIDSVLDLQHNTDILLSNTEFSYVGKEFLDVRKDAKDLGYLINGASPKVKKLVRGMNRHFGLDLTPTSSYKLINTSYLSRPESTSSISDSYSVKQEKFEAWLIAQQAKVKPEHLEQFDPSLRPWLVAAAPVSVLPRALAKEAVEELHKLAEPFPLQWIKGSNCMDETYLVAMEGRVIMKNCVEEAQKTRSISDEQVIELARSVLSANLESADSNFDVVEALRYLDITTHNELAGYRRHVYTKKTRTSTSPDSLER